MNKKNKEIINTISFGIMFGFTFTFGAWLFIMLFLIIGDFLTLIEL